MNFPKEKIAAWEALKKRYPDTRAALIPVLHQVQEEAGWLSREALEWVAEFFHVPAVEVLETASFYWMLRLKPEGKYRIALCRNISCHLRGKDEVLRAVRDVTGLTPDPHGPVTSEDGLFSLRLVECMGACSSAPMMDINGEYKENLDYEKTRAILEEILEKEGRK